MRHGETRLMDTERDRLSEWLAGLAGCVKTWGPKRRKIWWSMDDDAEDCHGKAQERDSKGESRASRGRVEHVCHLHSQRGKGSLLQSPKRPEKHTHTCTQMESQPGHNHCK